jgi:hypothetical protein
MRPGMPSIEWPSSRRPGGVRSLASAASASVHPGAGERPSAPGRQRGRHPSAGVRSPHPGSAASSWSGLSGRIVLSDRCGPSGRIVLSNRNALSSRNALSGRIVLNDRCGLSGRIVLSDRYAVPTDPAPPRGRAPKQPSREDAGVNAPGAAAGRLPPCHR